MPMSAKRVLQCLASSVLIIAGITPAKGKEEEFAKISAQKIVFLGREESTTRDTKRLRACQELRKMINLPVCAHVTGTLFIAKITPARIPSGVFLWKKQSRS